MPDNIGLLYHSHLAMFGPREMLLSSEEPVVRQFLNAQTIGPIGMSEEKDADELAAEAAPARSSRRCRRSRSSSAPATARPSWRAARRAVVPRQRRHPAARVVPVAQRRCPRGPLLRARRARASAAGATVA